MPPLVGVAVNVLLTFWQIAPAGLDTMLTDGVNIGFTVIVMPALVPVVGDGQVALLVITQVTTSPFASVLLE